jgi:hypothetical protein
MRLRNGWLLVLCLAVLNGGGVATADDEVSAQNLIRLAPVIDTTNGAHRSVRIEGVVRFGIELRFRALYRAPDQHALFFEDGGDGTPLFLASNGQLIVYDPVNAAALLDTNDHVTFSIGCKHRRLDWNFGFNSQKDKPSKIDINVASLYSTADRADSAAAVDGHRYRLISHLSDGPSMLAMVDLARPCPFTRIDLVTDQDDQPWLTLDTIAVDEELGDEWFAMPDKARLSERVAVHDLSGTGFFKEVTGAALVMRAIYARIGANDPEIRETIKYPGLIGIDWAQVQQHDREFSQAFREAIHATRK